jgi:hypothetical protein
MTPRPITRGREALRLVYWNTDGVRGRKLELEQCLSEYGVEIGHLDVRRLEWCRAPRSRTVLPRSRDLPTRKRGRGILVRRGADHCAVPVSGLQNLEAAATPTVGNHTSEARGGLPLAHMNLGRVRPDKLFEGGGIPRLICS